MKEIFSKILIFAGEIYPLHEASYHIIIAKLTEQGGDGKLIAEVMRERVGKVFGESG